MHLISPAIGASFEKILTTNAWPSKMRSWFDFQLGMDIGDKPAGHRVVEVLLDEDNKQSTVHRAHFLDELIALIPSGVAQFGKRLTGLDQSGDSVILSFADGTTGSADAVVGCDGVKSACRGIMFGPDNSLSSPRFTGRYAYRSLVPMDKAVELLGDEKARNRAMYMGRNGHVLTFPIQHGEVLNVVAFHKSNSEEWEGEWVQNSTKEALFADFEGWGDNVLKLLSVGIFFSTCAHATND
jgi:salicylate hydroxylase